jgi:hypothetical protein
VETHLRFGVGNRTESDLGRKEMIMRRDHETRWPLHAKELAKVGWRRRRNKSRSIVLFIYFFLLLFIYIYIYIYIYI